MNSSDRPLEREPTEVGNENPGPGNTSRTGMGTDKQNKIIKRFGGRHLIFRTKVGGWWMVPKPYLLISSFRGPVWVFYGAGQIWFTHKKDREIENWFVRRPRLGSKVLSKILDRLEPQLKDFVHFCNSRSVEGTIVIERKVIEFHWTFGNEPLPKEKEKPENAGTLESNFRELVDAFLAAKEELGF